MPAGTTFRNAVCNVMRATNFTAFTPQVALFNGDPSGAGTEVTNTIRGASAGRVAVTFANAPSNGVMQNSAAVTFTASAVAGATVTHFAIYDNATQGAGNLMLWAALTASQTIAAGNPVSFAVGAITITVT